MAEKLFCALLAIFVEELRVTGLVVCVSLSVPCVPKTDADVEEIDEAIDADAADASDACERLACKNLVHYCAVKIPTVNGIGDGAETSANIPKMSPQHNSLYISACLISSAGARRKRIRTPIDGASPRTIALWTHT